MTQPFKCPSCGAPLSLENAGATLRCPFCGNSVIVPEHLRTPQVGHAHPGTPSLDNIISQAGRLGELGQLVRSGNKIAAIKLYRELFGTSLKDAKDAVERLERGEPIEVMNVSGGAYQNVQINPAQFPPVPTSFQSPQPPQVRGCWVVPVLIILLVIGASVALVAYLSSSKVRETVSSIPFVPSSSKGGSSSPVSSTGFASIALEFGSEGIGPGQFKDARSIGVDGEGRIYVAEYIGGRVQVFDAQGKYLAGWMVDQKMPLRGMAVDRKGNVYIAQKGVITRYEGMTGKSLGELRGAGVSRFDDVAVTQDGGLLATAYAGGADDIVRFNANGQVIQTMRKAISGQTDDSELNMRIASDGLGNIYALGTFNDAVFKFTREGRFVTRIGGEGNEPGQFRAASAIAVDGQGRVFVSDVKGIQVFDTDGRYLDVIKVPNHVAFGLIFNDRNELLSASRSKVFKFSINKNK